MPKITQIQNITGAPIIINNVTVAPLKYYVVHPKLYAFWLNDDYTDWYESPDIKIYFDSLPPMTIAANGSDFTNAFIYTANLYRNFRDIFQDNLNQQSQVTTNTNVLTPVAEFAYPNGNHQPIVLFDATQTNNNNRYLATYFPKITVRNGIAAFVGSATSFAQVANDGFNTGSGFGPQLSVSGNRLVLSVRGRTPDPILWKVFLNAYPEI